MKKKISAFLLALALCMSFSACGSSDEEAAAAAETEAVTTAETTAATTTEAASSAEETTTAKKKKKKSKSSDSSKTDSKKKKKKTTTAAETEAPEKADEAVSEAESGKMITIENEAYVLSFPEDKWVSLNDFKSIIAQYANENSTQYKNFDLESFIGDMYFYKDEATKEYPTNIIITTPIYQAGFLNVSMSDVADLLVESVKQQWTAEQGISYSSHDIVTHNGIQMLRIRANCEKGATYICDEYVFLAKGNMCVIAVNYLGGNDGLTAFNNMLDSITIK